MCIIAHMPEDKVQFNVRLGVVGADWVKEMAHEYRVSQATVIRHALALTKSNPAKLEERLSQISETL